MKNSDINPKGKIKKQEIDFNGISEIFTSKNIEVKVFKKSDERNDHPVLQLTEDFEIVGCFGSLDEAFTKTNIDKAKIRRVCSGLKTFAGGYRWLTINNYLRINTSNDEAE